jgi:hypothetical protein
MTVRMVLVLTRGAFGFNFFNYFFNHCMAARMM